jgi:hypothetical protein
MSDLATLCTGSQSCAKADFTAPTECTEDRGAKLAIVKIETEPLLEHRHFAAETLGSQRICLPSLDLPAHDKNCDSFAA